MLEIVVLVLSRFADGTPEDDEARAELLDPLVKQHARLRERNQRHGRRSSEEPDAPAFAAPEESEASEAA